MKTLFPHAACLQLAIAPGEIAANLRCFRAALAAAQLPEHTLVVLPELWAAGLDAASAEQTAAILAQLQREAAARSLWFAGSLPEPQEQGHPCNTLFLVGPAGVAGRHRKQHLFRFWQEEKLFQAGTDPQPINSPFGPLAALVCYDLRFPELARQQIAAGSRLLAVSAQWPAVRLDHWRLLVQARAVENQAFVAACNGCGLSSHGRLAGHSLLVDPWGRILAEAGQDAEVIQAALNEEELESVRARFCTSGEQPWSAWSRSKIVGLTELQARLALVRRQKSRIVFTNGCFDLLHAGHVSYLEQARACGDCLVVGLNSDRSVRALKGPSRPVNSEQERARVLAGLGCVDYVIVFDEDTPQRLIAALLPDILVKGADWPEEQIVGAAEVKAKGGEVRRIAFDCHTSSSGIIAKVIAAQAKLFLPREPS